MLPEQFRFYTAKERAELALEHAINYPAFSERGWIIKNPLMFERQSLRTMFSFRTVPRSFYISMRISYPGFERDSVSGVIDQLVQELQQFQPRARMIHLPRPNLFHQYEWPAHVVTGKFKALFEDTALRGSTAGQN